MRSGRTRRTRLTSRRTSRGARVLQPAGSGDGDGGAAGAPDLQPVEPVHALDGTAAGASPRSGEVAAGLFVAGGASGGERAATDRVWDNRPARNELPNAARRNLPERHALVRAAALPPAGGRAGASCRPAAARQAQCKKPRYKSAAIFWRLKVAALCRAAATVQGFTTRALCGSLPMIHRGGSSRSPRNRASAHGPMVSAKAGRRSPVFPEPKTSAPSSCPCASSAIGWSGIDRTIPIAPASARPWRAQAPAG